MESCSIKLEEGKDIFYRVKNGDTLSEIALSNNISVKELVKLNNIEIKILTTGKNIKINKNNRYFIGTENFV